MPSRPVRVKAWDFQVPTKSSRVMEFLRRLCSVPQMGFAKADWVFCSGSHIRIKNRPPSREEGAAVQLGGGGHPHSGLTKEFAVLGDCVLGAGEPRIDARHDHFALKFAETLLRGSMPRSRHAAHRDRMLWKTPSASFSMCSQSGGF